MRNFVVCTVHLINTLRVIKSRRLRWQPTRKRPLGTLRRRWEDNINMNLEVIGVNTWNCADSSQDMEYCERGCIRHGDSYNISETALEEAGGNVMQQLKSNPRELGKTQFTSRQVLYLLLIEARNSILFIATFFRSPTHLTFFLMNHS